MAAPKVLAINLRTSPDSLEPALARDIPGCVVARLLFEGLMRKGSHGELRWGIAESVEIDPSGLHYLFTLRPASWSDGSSLNAYDFEASWKRVLSPKFPAPFAFYLYGIQGAKDAKEGKTSLNEIGVQALDDRHLLVTLEAPQEHFLEVTAFPISYPLPASIRRDGALFSENQFLCNGPFQVQEWLPQDSLVLKRNPSYWKKEELFWDQITCSMVADEHTELLMFQRGDIQWAGAPCSTLPTDAMEVLREDPRFHQKDLAGTWVLKFNTQRFPLNNRSLRKALNLAINRKVVIDHVLQAMQKPALALLPPNTAFAGREYFSDHDVEGAQTVFQEALDELNLTAEEFPEICLMYTQAEKHEKVSQLLQQQWKEVLGINIRLQAYEWNCFLAYLGGGNFDIGGRGWVGAFSDPQEFLDLYARKNGELGGGANDTGWADPTFQELLQEARQLPDGPSRKDLLEKAENLLLAEQPFAPLYHSSACFLVAEGLENYVMNEFAELDFAFSRMNNPGN